MFTIIDSHVTITVKFYSLVIIHLIESRIYGAVKITLKTDKTFSKAVLNTVQL